MGHIFEEPHRVTHILQRNDRAAYWTEKNPILVKGEMGVEIDTGRFKFGDGLKTWNELDYAADSEGSSSAVDARLSAHMENIVAHTTQEEKDLWNSKSDGNHDHDGKYDPIGAAANKMDKVPTATQGNLAVFDDSGNVQDCGSSSDALADIQQLKTQLEKMKLDLENKVNEKDLSDKDWIPIPFRSGFNGNMQYSKDKFGCIWIKGQALRGDTAIEFNTIFADLPIGFRPPSLRAIQVALINGLNPNNNYDVGIITVLSNGEMKLVKPLGLTDISGGSIVANNVYFPLN